MDRDIRSRKEKIESKGAYAYDLHEAIRDVRRALAEGDLKKAGLRLEALKDICAPEIRRAVMEEWPRIDRKYQDRLERVQKADFKAGAFLKKKGWERDYDGNETFYIPVNGNLTQYSENQLEEDTRNKFLFEIWDKILHERFRACIDCLDRHGELRKWREVEYGRL